MYGPLVQDFRGFYDRKKLFWKDIEAGPPLVHFSAQSVRFVWDRGCA